MSHALHGQTQGPQTSPAGAVPLVITAYNGGPPINYTVPRTPWGAPDLEGVWSGDDVGNVPGGRPASVGGRLYLTDEEFKTRQASTEKGVLRAENAEGVFRNAFARRAFRQTSIIVDPPDGRQVFPRAEAQTSRRAPRDEGTFGNGPFDRPEDFTLHERCITLGIWGSAIPFFDHNGIRIVQAPGMVAISYEMIHDTRIVYTDGRPHIGDAIRQYLGDSRARWDGDVLIIETTNLTDKTSIGVQGSGTRHSDRMKITEQFKRVASDILQYQITIDDPITYPMPFTASLPLTALEGGVLLPYDCHEGSLTVLQSLGAERAEDAALAADLAKGIKRPRRGVREGGAGLGRAGGFQGGRAGAGGSSPAVVQDPFKER